MPAHSLFPFFSARWLLLALVLAGLFRAPAVAAAGYSYDVPACGVSMSINAANQVVFTLTLTRALAADESLQVDLGREGTPAGISNPIGVDSCLDSGLAVSSTLGPNFVGSTGGDVIYSVGTLVGSPGCYFAPDGVSLPVTFRGFLLVSFLSSSISQAVYFGQVSVTQLATMSNPSPPYATAIVPVIQDTITVGQQLAGRVYRLNQPLASPPLSATPNAYIVLSFEVTSDLPFLYWLQDFTVQLCSTASCLSVTVSGYDGAFPPVLDLPLPATSFGSDDTHPANKLLSFWAHIPPTADTLCPSGPTPVCALSCVLTLATDPTSVHNFAVARHTPQLLTRRTPTASAQMRQLATGNSTAADLAAGASVSIVFVPVNSLASVAASTASATAGPSHLPSALLVLVALLLASSVDL